jgi:hypothetical protein
MRLDATRTDTLPSCAGADSATCCATATLPSWGGVGNAVAHNGDTHLSTSLLNQDLIGTNPERYGAR